MCYKKVTSVGTWSLILGEESLGNNIEHTSGSSYLSGEETGVFIYHFLTHHWLKTTGGITSLTPSVCPPCGWAKFVPVSRNIVPSQSCRYSPVISKWRWVQRMCQYQWSLLDSHLTQPFSIIQQRYATFLKILTIPYFPTSLVTLSQSPLMDRFLVPPVIVPVWSIYILSLT